VTTTDRPLVHGQTPAKVPKIPESLRGTGKDFCRFNIIYVTVLSFHKSLKNNKKGRTKGYTSNNTVGRKKYKSNNLNGKSLLFPFPQVRHLGCVAVHRLGEQVPRHVSRPA